MRVQRKNRTWLHVTAFQVCDGSYSGLHSHSCSCSYPLCSPSAFHHSSRLIPPPWALASKQTPCAYAPLECVARSKHDIPDPVPPGATEKGSVYNHRATVRKAANVFEDLIGALYSFTVGSEWAVSQTSLLLNLCNWLLGSNDKSGAGPTNLHL